MTSLFLMTSAKNVKFSAIIPLRNVYFYMKFGTHTYLPSMNPKLVMKIKKYQFFAKSVIFSVVST